MKKVEIFETLKLSSPHLFALLVSENSEKFNVMAVSWFCFASLKPPKMLVCLSNKGYTGELLKKSGRFTLCLPTEKISEESMKAGRLSGRNIDKPKEIGFEWVWPEGFEVPAVEGSKIAWSLSLCDMLSAGDHTVYLADIKCAAQMSDKDILLAFNAYSDLHTIEK